MTLLELTKQISEGQKIFYTQVGGENNECEILKIDMISQSIYVKLKNPTMVTQTRWVSRLWSEDEYLESYEEETYNIWLNLDYRDQRGGEQLEIKF